jgi:NAD(P)-dependent dehydrogenase (short-subunit alcohol dehydrogenase family)
MQIANKVVIVTGAASGLGLATCRALLAQGAKVAAFDLKALSADAYCGSKNIIALPVDVSDETSVSDGVARTLEAFGVLHVAVNCAGVVDAAKTLSKGEPFPLATWNKVIGVNLTGTFNVIRFAAQAMSRNEPEAESGERGVIINTASGAAWQGQIGQAAYSASKAGVMGLTLPVARDLANLGIRVVSIAPGMFATAMSTGLAARVLDSIIEKMILFPNRMGDPDEFAALVEHIVKNSYFNATTVNLDGGVRISTR